MLPKSSLTSEVGAYEQTESHDDLEREDQIGSARSSRLDEYSCKEIALHDCSMPNAA